MSYRNKMSYTEFPSLEIEETKCVFARQTGILDKRKNQLNAYEIII